MAANAVRSVVGPATHGEVLLIEEAKPRETPETHSRMGIHSESIAMWQLFGRPDSCPEAKETEYYAFLLINLYFSLAFCLR